MSRLSKLLNRVVDAPKPHSLIAGTVAKPATLHKRHEAASANEYAVAKEGAVVAPEDVVDPHAAPPSMDGQAKFYERGLASVGIHPQVTTIPAVNLAKCADEHSHREHCPACNPFLNHPRSREEATERFAKAARDRLRMEHCKTCNLPMKPSEQDAIRSEFEAAALAFARVCPDVDASPFCPTCGSGLTCYEKSRPAAPEINDPGHNGGWICRDCGGFDECEPNEPEGD